MRLVAPENAPTDSIVFGSDVRRKHESQLNVSAREPTGGTSGGY